MPRPDGHTDTIAAVATAPGRGGIGIVRISGPEAQRIAVTLCGTLPRPRVAGFRVFAPSAGEVIDSGIVLYFPAPSSFTGEEVVELHGHGGPVVLHLLMQSILSAGARLARPGEFTERAFINGKIDLAQAEAIADLIDSASTEAARGASRSLQGEFSKLVTALIEELIHLRVLVEACIDFPDEDIDFITDAHVDARMNALVERLNHLHHQARVGSLLRDGLTVVLAGKPNAGKSSLMNCLAGHDAAIVSATPGTTRDVLREQILIDGMPVHVIDTAGLRESGDDVEREGISRALREAGKADLLLLVVDSSSPDSPLSIAKEHFSCLGESLPPLCIVLNKSDLSGLTAGECKADGHIQIAVSALTGAGLDALRSHISKLVGFSTGESGAFSARRRHLDAIARARNSLSEGLLSLNEHAAVELLAEHLRDAQRALGEITGQLTPDDLLGEIFSSFCIGK
jgi:tRNA modification GTPase